MCLWLTSVAVDTVLSAKCSDIARATLLLFLPSKYSITIFLSPQVEWDPLWTRWRFIYQFKTKQIITNTLISVHRDPLKSWSRRVATADDESEVIMDAILSCISHASRDVLRDTISEPSGLGSAVRFACCSDTVLCVGEQSSPRVIISPVSSRAGDSHWLPFFLAFFLLLLLLDFVPL